MNDSELLSIVKNNLKLIDNEKDLIISDVIQDIKIYCNISELTMQHEPFLRKKVKSILDYERENGDRTVFDIKSIKEGDVSITYNVDDNSSKETIYGLSEGDKKLLQRFRRLRR